MPARSGWPLELSALGLLSNCGCGLIALGAGFLDCCRPGRMGRRAASSGLASGDHLGSEVGGPKLESEWRPSALLLAGRANALASRCPGRLPRSKRSEGWEPAPAGSTGCPVSPQPVWATCTMLPRGSSGSQAWLKAAGRQVPAACVLWLLPNRARRGSPLPPWL